MCNAKKKIDLSPIPSSPSKLAPIDFHTCRFDITRIWNNALFHIPEVKSAGMKVKGTGNTRTM